MNWRILLERIDYHHKHWYERGEENDWHEITYGRLIGLLDELAPNADHAKLITQFRYRDREAHSRNVPLK